MTSCDVYCACHVKGNRGPSGAHARRSSSRTICVLRLPRASQLPQEALCTAPATQKATAPPAAPTRAAAPPEGSVYCACHTKGSRGPSGGHARRSSSRRLYVLRLPRKRQPRPQRRPRAPQLLQNNLCTAPATRKAAAAPAAATRAAAPPRGSVYCACHSKGAKKLSVLRLHATARRGPAAPTRAAAPPEGSVYCACHTKGSRGPSGGHARRSSSRRLYVLRLPRKRQPQPQRRPRAPQLLQNNLCTAPATRKAAAASAAATRAADPPRGSVYCARHAKGARKLSVLRLPRDSQQCSEEW